LSWAVSEFAIERLSLEYELNADEAEMWKERKRLREKISCQVCPQSIFTVGLQ